MQLSHKFESQREWQIKSKYIRNYDIIRDVVKPEKNSSKKLPLLYGPLRLKLCSMVSENRYLEKLVDS